MSPPDDARAGVCAVCGKPQHPEFRPFCSKRCADIDLGRWLKGNYVIPGRDVDEGERSTSIIPPQSDDDGEG